LKEIIIATRASALALWQAEYVKKEIEKSYPDIRVSLNKITSKGDKILDRPLALIGGKGHFTKELEDEMLAGNANLAVHSLKDVPTFIPEGLELVAVTKREDQSDVFLSFKYKSLTDLPSGAVVGTTSLRRRMQLLKIRPDLRVKDLRGNVNTRLKKLANGEYDAIILAYIGLKRLNLLKDIPYSRKIPTNVIIPPMGQASLGIEIVADDKDIREIALSLNDEDSAFLTKLERDFISEIKAGCSAPVAVNARFSSKNLVEIEAMIGFADGTNILHQKLQKEKSTAQNLGIELAKLMIENGAIDILKKAEELAFKDIRPDRL